MGCDHFMFINSSGANLFFFFQGERQMEAELSNLGGEVMAGQQLQVHLNDISYHDDLDFSIRLCHFLP